MKWFALLGFLLFLGVAVAPSINANGALDEKLVNVDIKIYGNNKDQISQIQLTQQEYNDIKTLFTTLNNNLDDDDTTEEAIKIINNVIKTYEKNDLIQKLRIPELLRLIKLRNSIKKPNKEINNDTRNCIVIGETTETAFDSLPSLFFYNLGLLPINLYVWADINNHELLYNLLDKIFNYTQFFPFFIVNFFAFGYSYLFANFALFAKAYRINLGYIKSEPDVQDEYIYSEGWIRTISTQGSIQYNGPMMGDLPQPGTSLWMGAISTENLPAVTGFTGIKIRNKQSDITHYFGFAHQVKIKEIL